MDTEHLARTAVDALVAEGLVGESDRSRSAAVVERALEVDLGAAEPLPAPSSPAHATGIPKLIEVVAYLGAALVLAAAVLFLRQSWQDLSKAGQVGVLAGAALALGIAGLVAGPRPPGAGDQIRRRLGGTLLAGSALAAGFAAGVAVDAWSDASPSGIDLPGLTGAGVTAVLSAIAYRRIRTALGLLGILGGTVLAVGNVASALAADEPLSVGCSLFVVAGLWLFATEAGMFAEPMVARALGVAVALLGSQVASFTGNSSWVGYLLSLVLAGAGVWLYVSRLTWPYLAGAVLAVTLVVPEAVSDWTAGSLGVVGAVLLAGLSLLAGSLTAYRIRRHRSA